MSSPFAIDNLPLVLLMLILMVLFLHKGEAKAFDKPSNCGHLECAPYEVIHSQNEMEIRSYKNSNWMSTSPINSTSYKQASNLGFNALFTYIQGKNHRGVKIEMTAPVLVDIFPSTGPFCNSTFIVHFYLPKKFQKDTPGSDYVHKIRSPGHQYAAVQRFGGFMDDTNVPLQASALKKSLKGSPWESVIANTHSRDLCLTVLQAITHLTSTKIALMKS
ncbi:hypothetical protein GIB67_018880 [Kingdonia uniflora]|uniref:Uncharacterized protein n=1 Tax=Kingdonia uniflora TaxID=39325 RepID=A0A7J7MZA1_9MAGN|nr:hypothetical protein GIB67_018880 [Kingdonia uniflora]